MAKTLWKLPEGLQSKNKTSVIQVMAFGKWPGIDYKPKVTTELLITQSLNLNSQLHSFQLIWTKYFFLLFQTNFLKHNFWLLYENVLIVIRINLFRFDDWSEKVQNPEFILKMKISFFFEYLWELPQNFVSNPNKKKKYFVGTLICEVAQLLH